MPDRETPVVLRAAHATRAAKTTKPQREARNKQRRVMVIGLPADLPRALAHPSVASGRFEIVSTIGVDIEGADEDLSALNSAMDQVRLGRIDTLLVAGDIGAAAMRRVADIAIAFHCEVLAMMPTEVLKEHDPVVVWTHDGPLIQLARLPRHPFDRVAKRGIDILGASTGLLLSFPVLVVLAGLIVLESKGSFLFRHERVGFRGQKFKCLKLRTMRPDAEDVLRMDATMYTEYRQNHYKIPDDRDPRVTRVGKFLRRTSLDELPQFWNVLRGEMSLVGPRPVVEAELREYGHDQDLVLSVKPGLTGAWAVSGRQSVGYPERCEIELGYVRARNVLTDLKIMARTIEVVFRGSLKAGLR